MTLGDKLEAAGNRPAGFDYMRLGLSVAVIATHTINVCYGVEATKAFWSTPWRIPFSLVLPMFFALSGFLIAGSLERAPTIISFLGLRGFRLVPALAVETTLCALILGPIFTDRPLAHYFSDPLFRAYFWNIAGHPQFVLPGVFHGMPWPPMVNMQLWTLPYELACYALLSVLAVTTIVRRPALFLVTAIALEAGEIIYRTFIKPFPDGITVGGPALVMSFLFGIALYLFRARVPWNKWLFAAAAVLCAALSYKHATSYAVAIPAAYLTAFLGVTAPPRIRALLSGDYSYGLFLYGFPIQQAVSATFPDWRYWWFNLPLSLMLAGSVAYASWWVIEKPANDRRKAVFAIEAWILERAAGLARALPFTARSRA